MPRANRHVFHRDARGVPDYSVALTGIYTLEADRWVGVCEQLGTPAFAETLEQVRSELQDAVQLQLNKVERLADVREYLEESAVPISPFLASNR